MYFVFAFYSQLIGIIDKVEITNSHLLKFTITNKENDGKKWSQIHQGLLFCRFWARDNFSIQLKILKPYVALISHFKGLFSTIHCQFSWHQSNKISTQFYSQFRNFFPINVLYKIFQIFNKKKIMKIAIYWKKSKFRHFEVRITFEHLHISH